MASTFNIGGSKYQTVGDVPMSLREGEHVDCACGAICLDVTPHVVIGFDHAYALDGSPGRNVYPYLRCCRCGGLDVHKDLK